MKTDWASGDELPAGVVKLYTNLFLKNDPVLLIKNADTKFKVLHVEPDIYFPVTINDREWENSFVCSPFTAYALYSKDEIRRKIKNKLVKLILFRLISIISKLLRLGEINKNIHINNFLLSTNPYPSWNGESIDKVTRFITSEYPGHAIIFRSLNQNQHHNLIRVLQHGKYRLIGSRQVYIYDQCIEEWRKHNNNRQDLRIVKNKRLVYLAHEEMGAYLEEALLLYQKLYLKKYSIHNPQFTLKYFKECHKNNILIFQGYKDQKGKLKTFCGLFILGNTITSPLVGYDTGSPQNERLYIHAIQLIFNYKFKTGKVLNLSSGASQFKRLRGGEPSIEYSAIYIDHLKLKRKFTWKVLQFVSNKVGVTLIKKYEL